MNALPAFLNACRILYSIDMRELTDAGALHDDDTGGWQAFRGNPVNWLLHQDDATQRAVWRIVERRQPERYRQDKAEAN